MGRCQSEHIRARFFGSCGGSLRICPKPLSCLFGAALSWSLSCGSGGIRGVMGRSSSWRTLLPWDNSYTPRFGSLAELITYNRTAISFSPMTNLHSRPRKPTFPTHRRQLARGRNIRPSDRLRQGPRRSHGYYQGEFSWSIRHDSVLHPVMGLLRSQPVCPSFLSSHMLPRPRQ